MQRFSRRSKTNDEDVVLSARLDMTQPDDTKFLRNVLPHSVQQGNQPWHWYEVLGDVVHQGVARGARTAGYAKLAAYELDKFGQPGKKITTGVAGRTAALLSSPYGGQRALMERMFTIAKIPGDSYLVRCRENNEVIGYDVLDAAEIDLGGSESGLRSRNGKEVFQPGQKIARITHPKIASGERLEVEFEAQDFIGRIWRPTARYVDVADSPMQALEDTCEQLWLLTRRLRAKLLGSLVMNGILFVPSEINEVRSSAPASEQMLHANRIIDGLLKAGTWAIQHPGDPASAMPVIVSGPGDQSENLRFILTDAELYEVDMRLRRELIDRILMGLDVVPEGVKGNSETNHWGAWVNADDDLKVNIRPEVETFCWALTRCVLHAEMQAANIKPGIIAKTVIWYDLSQANVKTNIAEDARQAYDRGLVGPTGTRRMTGIPESEAPTNLEIIRSFGYEKGVPYMATYDMPEAKKFDWDKIQVKPKTGPGAQTGGDPPESSPSKPAGGPGDNQTDTPRKDRPA